MKHRSKLTTYFELRVFTAGVVNVIQALCEVNECDTSRGVCLHTAHRSASIYTAEWTFTKEEFRTCRGRKSTGVNSQMNDG